MLRLFVPSLVLLLCACGRVPSSEYFPLDPGMHWRYVVHEQNPVTDTAVRLDIGNLRPKKRDGARYARRLASDGNEYWIGVTDKAVQRVGVRSAIDFEPRMDESPRIVMPLPTAVGQWWQVESRPYILERLQPFRERFTLDDSKTVNLHMKVAALDDTVEVPAGKFERCLRLEGTGAFNVLADARIGSSEVPVVHTEWYAPGVGLVKLARSEALTTEAVVGGTVTMELVEFER